MAETQDFLSMLDAQPDLKQSLVSIGTNALQSGKVDPMTAKKMASSVGAKQLPDDDYLTKYLGGGKQDPYNFGPGPEMSSGAPASEMPSPMSSSMPALKPQLTAAMVPNPGGAAAGKKGSVINSSLKSTQNQGEKKIQNTYLDKDNLNSIAESLRSVPEVSGALGQPKDLEDQLSMIKNMNVDKDSAWIKPLLALTDSQTGSHFSQSYQPGGMTPAERNQLLLKYQDEVQKRKGDIAKTFIEGIGKIKSGTDQTTQNQQLLQALANNQNNASAAGGLASTRTDALRLRAGQDFDTDKILTQMTTTNNSLDRALSMMNGKTPITGKNFALLQQDMINAMSPGGAATEGKVNREMVETLAATLNDVQQKFGDIEDLRKEQPQIFAQLQGLIKQVKEDYNRAGQQRVQEKLLNSRQMGDEGARKTAEDKATALMKKFGGDKAAPKPKTITQNGHTYSLNEATGEYE